MSESFDFPSCDWITVGTVGPAGRRVFFLQARSGARVVCLKVEKAQVAALAEYLFGQLADLPPIGEPISEVDPESPVHIEWVVGALGIGYDAAADRLMLMAEEAVPEGEEGGVARFALTRPQVAALATRGRTLVEAGRPMCPLCGNPVDPSGHACPHTNGHTTSIR